MINVTLSGGFWMDKMACLVTKILLEIKCVVAEICLVLNCHFLFALSKMNTSYMHEINA